MKPRAHVFRNDQVERRAKQAVTFGVSNDDVELIAGARKRLTPRTYAELERRRMRCFCS
jgi:hypothetical protein